MRQASASGFWSLSPVLLFMMLSASALLGLLLISHHLELVHLLQLGDLEGAMGLTGLHLEVVDLHVPLLDGVLHVELLAEDGAALVVQLLHKGRQVFLRHGQGFRSLALKGKIISQTPDGNWSHLAHP